MKEALFYNKVEGSKAQCQLCPQHCLIANGQRGLCGVRENKGGKLYSLVYGKIVSSHVDPIEKKPLFHFLPGSYSYSIATVGCNLRCDFCQNWEISQMPREQRVILGEERSPADIVSAALANDCQSIAYTYTEPTVFFEFAYDTARLAQEKKIKNVFVTNGYIDPHALEMIAPCLAAANVDLKSFSDEYYRKVCGGRLGPVLDTLKLMRELRIWVEVTTLIIPSLNDSADELAEIAGFIKNKLGGEVPWHLSAFHPDYKIMDRPRTPAEILVKAREIGLKAGLKYIYIGNLALPGAEDTYCPNCKKLLIQRSAFTVLENNLKKGKCFNCGEAVSGVWD